jgi:phosphoserine phosphatase RsbU/P
MLVRSTALLATDSNRGPSDLRQILETAGFTVQLTTFDATDLAPAQHPFVVLDCSGDGVGATAFCRRWREHRGDAESAVIWVGAAPEERMAGWQAGADAVLASPLAFGELPAQIERLTLLSEEKAQLRQRAGESTHINQTLIELYQQHDVDFRIARRIQRSCRPKQLPAVGSARFAVSHRERRGSPGDFHNVIRVDEDRVAFFLGDVMGQSLTSCMLSVFIHQSVTPKEITGQAYRVLPPEEVLQRLGRALAVLGMPDPPLVRIAYGLLNCQTGEMNFACAGHSPLLHLPSSGPAEFWRAPGSLLALGDAPYNSKTASLRPGDRVLLFTDGLPGPSPQPIEAIQAAAEIRRDLPLHGLVATVVQDLLSHSTEPDDFTLLGLQFG